MPQQPTMTVDEFVEKWSNAALREKANSQTHFNDLCAMLGVETPVEGDPTGDTYTFEKRVDLHDGTGGDADVWKQDHFGWEYKSGGKSLVDAYEQLSGYREGLGNPPLLVVCDMSRFEIHTNFTNTAPRVIAFSHRDLRENPAHYRRILRDVFTAPDNLHPNNDPRYITVTAAATFGSLFAALEDRDGHDRAVVARFLNRIVFCLFAESVKLFDYRGYRHRPLADLFEPLAAEPDLLHTIIADLFDAMASETRIAFGQIPMRWFNGGLFAESASGETLRLTGDLIQILKETAELNWARINPAIFGTLFERGIDPTQRRRLGAHYTDVDTIMRVIEPVVMRPLRAEFEALKNDLATEQTVRESSAEYAANGKLALDVDPSTPRGRVRAFLDRLANVRVLDPACGSGNFLYVAMRELKNFEQSVIDWAVDTLDDSGLPRRIGPHNMLGIDIDPFAVELTRLSLWIGSIQWGVEHDFRDLRDPVLGGAGGIEHRDAILAQRGREQPGPAPWPDADFIVGNPPFLGSRRMRQALSADYVDRLHRAWGDEMGGQIDLSMYWHEQARRQIQAGASSRAGLLAPQTVRAEFSRGVLEGINESGRIFEAWSSEAWQNERGAKVRIAIICQDDGSERQCRLDGADVPFINPDLTEGIYAPAASELPENRGIAFQGVIPNGAFDIAADDAERMLAEPINPNLRENREVISKFVIARDLAQRPRGRHLIDFPPDMPEGDAMYFDAPYRHLLEHVRAERQKHGITALREKWWILQRWRPAMRNAIEPLQRFIATPEASKYRFFVWLAPDIVPDHTVVAIARDDDYTFGVLHSRVHEVWSNTLGAQLGKRPRYRIGVTFNTFPFPWPLDTAESDLTLGQLAHRDRIAAAAKALDDRREHWLNPPGVNPILLQERTITELYNDRPRWLEPLHRDLDAAVAEAYGWPADISRDDILAGLLALNLERAGV